jgi:hypothetical protein
MAEDSTGMAPLFNRNSHLSESRGLAPEENTLIPEEGALKIDP